MESSWKMSRLSVERNRFLFFVSARLLHVEFQFKIHGETVFLCSSLTTCECGQNKMGKSTEFGILGCHLDPVQTRPSQWPCGHRASSTEAATEPAWRRS